MMTSLVLALSPSDGSDDLMASLWTEEVLPGEVSLADAEGTPYRTFCTPGSPATVESRVKLQALSMIARTMLWMDGPQDVAEAYSVLAKDPCFRDLRNFQFNFEERSAQAIKAWWASGAEQWLASYLELGPSTRYVMLPPDLPISVEDARRPVPQHMLCADEAQCQSGKAWRTKADAELNAEFDACNTRAAKQDCSVDPSRSLPSRYQSWVRCAADRVNKRVELPIGALQPPTEGWLTLRQVEPDPERSCAKTGIYSLTTGDAWVVDTCQGGPPSVGRVPVNAIRELALLLAIQDDVRTQVRSKVVEIPLPQGLTPAWFGGDHGTFTGGLFGHRLGMHLPRHHLAWRVIVGGEEIHDNREGWEGCDPTGKVIREWAETVRAQFRPGCISGPNPPPSTWASLAAFNYSSSITDAEKRDAKTFEALMRKAVTRCAAEAP